MEPMPRHVKEDIRNLAEGDWSRPLLVRGARDMSERARVVGEATPHPAFGPARVCRRAPARLRKTPARPEARDASHPVVAHPLAVSTGAEVLPLPWWRKSGDEP